MTVDDAPARRVGWWLPFVALVPMVFLFGSLIPLSVKHAPGSVPGDVCALVPPDLVDRVVPAARKGDLDVKNAEPYTNVARCSAQTDVERATTTARGSLSVELRRHGTLAGMDPRAHAQDEFASDKRFELTDTITPGRVSDLGGLGDSAFVSVARPRDSDVPEHRSAVQLEVLDRDRILRLHYVASPTTDDRAVSAAVAVARALLGAVR
jgi:hypothetical protein